jgi:hypothetical protein
MSDGDSHAFFDLSTGIAKRSSQKIEQSFRNGTPLAMVGTPTSSNHCFPDAVCRDAQRLRSSRVRTGATGVHLYSAAFLKGGGVRSELLAVTGASRALVVIS